MQKSDINVLIVEDDTSQSNALVEAIKRLDYRPLAVKKPEEAESLVRIKPVHAVIADCMLPGKSGVDLVQKLRENMSEGATVILMSGIYRDKSFQTEAVKKTEAIHFFQKPFDMQEMMKTLDGQLKKLVEAPKVDLHALLAAPMASNRERRKALDFVEEMSGYDLPFVFCILMDSESSGHLNIVDEKQNIYGVTFAKGMVSKVDSEATVMMTKQILIQHGFITEDDLKDLHNKRSADLVKSLVDEGLISPHVQGIIKNEQILVEAAKLIGGSKLNINFVQDRKIKPEGDELDLSGFLPALHDIIDQKIPVEYLKEFYSIWYGHPVRLGPNYQDNVLIFALPLMKRVEGILDLIKKELTLEEILAQSKFAEADVFKAIHLLAVRRILVFEETKRVRNLDEHVNRLKSVYNDLKDKDPVQIFMYFGLTDRPKPPEVTKVYKEFAKSYHPDTLPQATTEEVRKLNHDLFARVTNAHDILTDDKKKAEYFDKMKQAEAERQLRSEDLIADAFALINTGKFVEALPKVEEACKLYLSEKAKMYRIWVTLKVGNVPPEKVDAMAAELKALPSDSRRLPLYNFVSAMLKWEQGDTDGAASDFDKAIQLDGNFIHARRELAAMKTSSGAGRKMSMNDMLTGDLGTVIGNLFKKKGA